MIVLILVLGDALGTYAAPVRYIRVQTVAVRVVRVGTGIVGRLLQPHQHVQEGVPFVFSLGGLARLETNVFRRYGGQSLRGSPGPGVRIQNELGGVRPGCPPAVQLKAFSGRFP